MAIRKRTTSVTDPAALAASLIDVAGRARELAQQQVQGWMENTRVPDWITSELKDLDWEIKDFSRDTALLTEYDRTRFRELKARRRELVEKRDSILQPSRENAEVWTTLSESLEKTARHLRRAPLDRDRLTALQRNVVEFYGKLEAPDRSIVQDVSAYLHRPPATASADSARAEAQVDSPATIAVTLPDPSGVEFDPSGEALLQRVVEGRFDSYDDCLLNRAAQHLSLVGGFEELMCLPLLHGIEHFPFQINTALQVLRRMRGRALLCDEVGLGKTIEAGMILKEYAMRGLARRILILTPPSLVSQWQEQMTDKFGMPFVTNDDPEFRSLGADAWGRFDRVIASLNTARGKQAAAAVQAQNYDLLIVDEAHHLRNRNTVSWKFVNGLKSKYVLLLTATPAQNNLDELFNLITLLSPGQLKTPAAFRREFVQTGDPRKPKNQTKLRELLMDVMIRNSRSQVHVGLPPRQARTIRVDLIPAERSLYDSVSGLVRTLMAQGGAMRMSAQTLQLEVGSSADAVLSTLTRMAARRSSAGARDQSGQEHKADFAVHYHESLVRLATLAADACGMAGAKLSAAIAMLQQIRVKVLVFTQFRETQRRLVRALIDSGIPTATFDGSMTAAEKDAQVRDFAGDAQVLVSTDVGSEGRNLQFCHTVLNYDLPWNPMRIEQRIGRVHRIGQTEPVTILNLAARDTVEDYVLEVLDSKINMFELVVGELGEILGNLDDDREFDEIVMDLWAQSPDLEAARAAYAQLGDQLVAAQAEYQQARDYDNALFADEFQAEK